MAKAIPEQVNTEEEYNELLNRIVSGAKTISDPLMDADKKDRYMQAYNKMVHVAREYRTRGE